MMTAVDRVQLLLDQHAIPYALIGAAALAAHGIARSTFDVDLLTTDGRVLDTSIWSPFGAQAVIRRGDLDDPLAGVVRVSMPDDRPVDVIVGKHAWQSRAVARAERMGQSAPVVLARDLILLKLYAGGAQDLWDVQEILRDADEQLQLEVTADVSELSRDMRDRWNLAKSPTDGR